MFYLFSYLAIGLASIVGSDLFAESTSIEGWSKEESQSFFAQHLPVRDDGKICISDDIKHIKLDIGLSWNAPMSQLWLAKQADLLVFGFEPNPRSIESIKNGPFVAASCGENYIDISHPIRSVSQVPELLGKRFFILPCALGLSQNKTMPFYVTGNDPGCSSLYVPFYFPIENILEVPILPLSAFFDVFPFDIYPCIDYIKIDAQGADLDIVKSAGDYLQEKVVCITLEPEDAQYSGTKNSFYEIHQYLSNKNFVKYDSKWTKDPTYVNKKFINYFIENNELYIFQQG